MAQKPPKRPTDAEMKAKAVARWENEGGTTRTTIKQPKRPRDLNQWAKRMVDLATGGEPEQAVELTAKEARAHKGGVKGGPARARALTPEQRSEIARIAAEARWRKS